ncbi:6-hydroxymethylpterin diphosphokinase MptE-like protein [Candidatus Altiarchaeota archaeon]
MAEDTRAAKILDRLVKTDESARLGKMIKGKTVIVYGCGPSLEDDLQKLFKSGIHSKCVNLAVDGAVKALLSYNIVPHINVSDLDGDIKSILYANKYGCVTVIHGHGDNINQLLKFVPHFKGLLIGTTQSDPIGKIYNFGGFTDGDRSVYLAEKFKPRVIILAGMDFGNVVGVFSGVYDRIKKPRKLRMGKSLIEKLAKQSKTPILNLTSGGEHIIGVQKIDIERLASII